MNEKQLPFWQMLLLIALIMSAITFFSGLGLILAKILYHFFTNGKIQPLANYILREEPWEFGWYMAVIFIFKNPRNQGVSRFQSGEELVNSVGK